MTQSTATALGHLDIKWIVICELSVQSAFASMAGRARDVGWAVELNFKDADGVALISSREWPSETFGSATYTKGDPPASYVLFWSTYAERGLTKINGGLYINQYAGAGSHFRQAAEQALKDLCTVFSDDAVLCIALSLEDDNEVEVGPGISGCYRPAIIQAVHPGTLNMLSPRPNGRWIDLHPFHGCVETPEGFCIITPEETRTAILDFQAGVSAVLWGDVLPG